MASLRSRLLALWVMLAASGAATAFLLLEFYRQSANAQVGRAEDVVSRACREIADRYEFLRVRGPGEPAESTEFKAQLFDVVSAALARASGVEGGLWRQGHGSLAYAFPTYEGTGPKTGFCRYVCRASHTARFIALGPRNRMEQTRSLMANDCILRNSDIGAVGAQHDCF
jgi:hypothetical protein